MVARSGSNARASMPLVARSTRGRVMFSRLLVALKAPTRLLVLISLACAAQAETRSLNFGAQRASAGFPSSLEIAAETSETGQNNLIGAWQFVDASFPLPESCRVTAIFQFTADGLFLGNDGSFEEKKRYTAKPYKKGFLVRFEYISNNGKSNCQGIPARDVKADSVELVYIELLNADRMKIYFGPDETKGFLILE